MNGIKSSPPGATAGHAAKCHIAFGVDSHYFRGMGVAIASIIEHNPDLDFVFHVFAFAVSNDNRNRLRQIEVRHRVKIDIHLIDPAAFGEYAKFPSFAQYSAAIFTRLLIPSALQGITDKVLYLDSDILCVGSIAELMSTDISDSIVALIHDNGEETVKNQCATLHLRGKRYFNSGVLYINIDNWIANRVTEKTMQTILASGRDFMFPDQDALNIVLDGHGKFIDGKWNFQYNLDNCLKAGDFGMRLDGEPVLIHFTGRVKPWHDWSMHEARAMFARYQAVSQWADMPLDAPKNYKEMRMLSRFLVKKKRVGQAVLWYMRYLVTKFTARQAQKTV